MSDRERYRPFTQDTETRLRFTAAPLAAVLCQVSWHPQAAFQTNMHKKALDFAAALPEFPLFAQKSVLQVEVDSDGQNRSEDVYELTSTDQAWVVTLTPTHFTLSSLEYGDFEEFQTRLASVLDALDATLAPQRLARVGVRYINLIGGTEELARIGSLVRPEVLGLQGLNLAGTEATLERSITQALLRLDEETLLQARAGVAPAGDVIDPLLGVLAESVWVFDIDAFSIRQERFQVANVLASASRLSDAAYDFFKFTIREGFKQSFGGIEL